jgi:cytochrome bd-type quinol oxidase subunit 2
MTLQITYGSKWKINATWLVLGGAGVALLGVALS